MLAHQQAGDKHAKKVAFANLAATYDRSADDLQALIDSGKPLGGQGFFADSQKLPSAKGGCWLQIGGSLNTEAF